MDKNLLRQKLESLVASAEIPPVDCQIFAKIPSTNQKLWQLIKVNSSLPLVAIALQQTAGRGQWGRSWISPPGGLYLSLGLATDLSLQQGPHLIYAVGWGIASYLRETDIPVLLKWPNDLVLSGQKLGGIKIETKITQDKITQVVIGVGLNYINPVPPTGINLSDIASRLSIEQLATITIKGIFHGYQFYLDQGIEKLLSAYLKIFSNLGQMVTINENQGIVQGVTAKGQLRVRLFSPGASVEIFLEPGTINLGYC